MKKRLYAIFAVFVFMLLLLTARLMQVQVLDSIDYASVNAKQQRIILNGEDTRGTIYDRNGNRLTGAEQSYIYIIKKELLNDSAEKIFEFIGARRVENKDRRYEVYRSKTFDKDAAYILKRDYEAFIIKGAERYAENQPAVHFIGYINQVDGTGTSGIEKSFNDILSKNKRPCMRLWTGNG